MQRATIDHAGSALAGSSDAGERHRSARRGESGGGALLTLALLIGLDRFFRLGSFGIWYDEALTWASIEGVIDFRRATYPLWFPAVRAVSQLAGGTDALGLRLLPALAGFASIALTWWAFFPVAGKRIAAAAALLVAASPWHLYLSQTSRPYTSALALFLFGVGLVLRGRMHQRPAWIVGGLAAAGGSALFHPMAGIGAAALAAATWLFAPRARVPRPARLALVLALVASSGYVVAETQTRSGLALLRDQPNPAHFLLTAGFHFEPLVLTAVLFGGYLAIRRRDALGLFALVVVGLMLATALALSLHVRVSARYVLWALPWLALLACLPLGVSVGSSGGRLLRVAYIALLVVPWLPRSGLYFFAWNGNRPYWREAYELVASQRAPNDLVLGHADLVGRYYLGAELVDGAPTVRTIDDWRETLDRELTPDARAWFVVRRAELADWPAGHPKELRRLLATECQLKASYVLVPTMGRDLTVDVFLYPGDRP